jgi:EAL domain-containing protein (putative c-di-GMP-specific phosphodiesterase class I)
VGAEHVPPDDCRHCVAGSEPDLDFTFAFQPIVDMGSAKIFSYESLVRGPRDEPAAWVLAQVTEASRYRFDQACRVGAITLAARLGIETHLNLNFMPNAVYQPELCIRSTFLAAEKCGFPIERIIFEVVENDYLANSGRLVEIMSAYKRFGFITALDDFGAGYRDLGLLAEFSPHLIKIDMHLLRGIDSDPRRQAIVNGIIGMCRTLEIEVVAEGIETFEEYIWLAAAGIDLFQGYLFAPPAFEAAPAVDFERFRNPAAPVSPACVDR